MPTDRFDVNLSASNAEYSSLCVSIWPLKFKFQLITQELIIIIETYQTEFTSVYVA